jgi:hypothetical protein
MLVGGGNRYSWSFSFRSGQNLLKGPTLFSIWYHAVERVVEGCGAEVMPQGGLRCQMNGLCSDVPEFERHA